MYLMCAHLIKQCRRPLRCLLASSSGQVFADWEVWANWEVVTVDAAGPAGNDFKPVKRVPDEQGRQCRVGKQAQHAEDDLPDEAVIHG